MPEMIVFDPHGELSEIIEELSEVKHTDSITGILNACYHRLHFIARAALADGDTEEQQRAWGMASALRQIIEADETREGQDVA